MRTCPSVGGESHQNPQASPRDADVAQTAAGKRQRGFAIGIRRKPTPLTGKLEATVRTKVTSYRCSRGRGQYPRTHKRLSKGPLLIGLGNPDYSRKKKAKQRLKPKLALLT